jgi:glycosyltransferase involved in cell wall biosynthesis
MSLSNLRLALFSGNYNYVRDGANQALNRLVGYLLREGANVRVYAPTIPVPAFEPTGDLVSLPSLPFPGRGEYRFPLGLSRAVKADLARFAPNVVHVSSPDVSAHRAVSWARKQGLPVLASVHTRFETYPRYYGLDFLEAPIVSMIRRFYGRCDAIVAPSESMARVLEEERMASNVGIWSRGVDRTIFDPSRRDLAWRRSLGIANEDVAVGFVGRLVMEKGLDVFADALASLRQQGISHKVLIIGEGPARGWLEERLPGAIYTGFVMGADLGRAVAGMDLLFNPSVTETFGNVTLEAMACGIPVVAAAATGSTSLVVDGVSGRLVQPGEVAAFAQVLKDYVEQSGLRLAHGQAGELRSREFDWDRINGTLAETYLKLVHSGRGGN